MTSELMYRNENLNFSFTRAKTKVNLRQHFKHVLFNGFCLNFYTR